MSCALRPSRLTLPGRAVRDLLAPPRCLACRRRAPPPWCAACEATLPGAGARCPRCAGPRDGGHRCWPPRAPIVATTSVHDYRGVVARAIVTAKTTGAHRGWTALAALLADRVAEDPPDVDVVTWVTTAPSRRRRRGIDHAEVLARAVGRRLDLPVARLLDVRVVPRHGERLEARCALPGSEVLLVDDIVTTGRTAVEAAAALQAAGAGNVRLAVIARAGAHELMGTPVTRTGPSRRTR